MRPDGREREAALRNADTAGAVAAGHFPVGVAAIGAMNGPFGLRRARCEEIAEFSGNDIPPHESASARLSRAVEDCAPPGSVTREDYLMPEFTMQAEALIRSIYAIAGRGSHRLAYAVRRLGCRAEAGRRPSASN